MSLPLSLLRQIQSTSTAQAWQTIFQSVWEICAPALEKKSAVSAVTKRDREVAALDLFLAAAGWDLWQAFDATVEHTADALANWWQNQMGGRAVLILDALSLREVPWILQGAAERGYNVSSRTTAAELPADTTQFAKALGFGQRSAISNNGAGDSHRLEGARTETADLPWADCAELIKAEPRWMLWHHWPDSRVHDFAIAGQGANALTDDAATKLTSEDFWLLIERLTTGRSLIITSDHGYAATGFFPDTPDDQQAKFLKEVFKSGRWTTVESSAAVNQALPPLDLSLTTRQGTNRFVLGRRKWKSQGGYPTLAHGGLSLLEVAVPFIELSR
ncbi:MAG TPA: hypothetical protein VGB07_01530 [Blastocatellia bacterium]